MAGGGGKGGKSEQKIDPKLTEAARDALDFAAAGAAIPHSPNRGVTIAGFTPQQMAAFQGANEAAQAFGMPTGAAPSMPPLETAANGIQGYSTGAIYDENKNKSMSPELQAAIDALFADRETGEFNGPMGPLFRALYGKGSRSGSGLGGFTGNPAAGGGYVDNDGDNDWQMNGGWGPSVEQPTGTSGSGGGGGK